MIDPELKKSIKNIIEEGWKKGNYSYGNFSDFVKKSLKDYEEKKLIPVYYEVKSKEKTMIKLYKEQIKFYNTFPSMKKYQVINSLLKAQLDEELTKLNEKE